MLQRFSINWISDEINYPIVTNTYRKALTVTVFASIIITLLNTDKDIKQDILIYSIQMVLNLFLLVDFIFRVIGSYKHQNMESIDSNLKYSSFGYIFSYYGFIDFISVIPLFLYIFDLNHNDLILILSLITILKVARFSPALTVLKDVVISEKDSLLAALYMMMILTLSLSTALYFIERDFNKGFTTILDSMWWAIVTLSTVGYGDIAPTSHFGRLVGGIAAITGFGMFALPAGILATGFANEVKRLKNITTWKIVKQVPIFSKLEFGMIVEISKLLHIKRFEKGDLIIKEGTIGESMYFILQGKVLVYNKYIKIILENGKFFGEIALIKNIPRTANVIAEERCEVLELTTYDFNNFIRDNADISLQIEEIARQRYQN